MAKIVFAVIFLLFSVAKLYRTGVLNLQTTAWYRAAACWSPRMGMAGVCGLPTYASAATWALAAPFAHAWEHQCGRQHHTGASGPQAPAPPQAFTAHRHMCVGASSTAVRVPICMCTHTHFPAPPFPSRLPTWKGWGALLQKIDQILLKIH